MKLKYLNIFSLLLLVFSIPSYSKPTIGIEFMWGIGESSSKTEGFESKFCKNRTWGALKGFGFYISNENLEAHISKYNHDTDAENCNRSNWALGLGPKISTKDYKEHDDFYLDWSVGLVYRFNETWRDHGNLSLYNRFRAGVSMIDNDDEQVSLELGWLNYGGFFEPNHGEDFLTLGINLQDLDPKSYSLEGDGDGKDVNNDDDDSGNGEGNEEDESITTIINNYNTTNNYIDNSVVNNITETTTNNTTNNNTTTDGGDGDGGSDGGDGDDGTGDGEYQDTNKGGGNDPSGVDPDNPGKKKA
jgi:hypothetical protein